MTSDFFTWFLIKHFLIACVIWPELAFAFAVYQRWWVWSVVLGLWIAGCRFNRLVRTLAVRE